MLSASTPHSHALELLEGVRAALEAGENAQAKALAGEFRVAAEAAGTPLVEGDRATFVVFAPEDAESVGIMGALSETDATNRRELAKLGDLDIWTTEIQMRDDAEFIYNIYVDKRVAEDPLCRRFIIGFGKHSVGRMPNFDPWVDRTVGADVPRGTIENFDVEQAAIEETRAIQVYLPPGYAAGEDEYPVLYIHDGPQALKDGRLDKIADALIAQNRIAPLILCFVPHRNRMDDYGFKPEPFAEFIVADLIPEMERRYRVIKGREGRGVTGTSMGGRISLYLILHHSDVFGTCLAQSSYFGDGDPLWTELQEMPHLPVRMYVDVGTFEREVAGRDLLAINRELRKLLEAKGFDVEYREWPGVHTWLMWSRGIGEALPIYWPSGE